MSHELQDDIEYTAEFIALVNSEPAINPRCCNSSIKLALERKLPGCEKAKENHDEIVSLIERRILKCRIEEINNQVWIPPPPERSFFPPSTIHPLPTRKKVDKKGYYIKELKGLRFHFTFKQAQAYVPGMGAFKNPLLKHEHEITVVEPEIILDQGSKELESLRLMLACIMRDTLKGSKYSGEGSISARAQYFQRIAIDYLENPRGFGNSTLRARIKDIDLLMSEKQKLKT